MQIKSLIFLTVVSTLFVQCGRNPLRVEFRPDNELSRKKPTEGGAGQSLAPASPVYAPQAPLPLPPSREVVSPVVSPTPRPMLASVPLCPLVIDGTASVSHAAQTVHSTYARVELPGSCANPTVLLTSQVTSLPCTAMGGGTTGCYNNPLRTQTSVRPYFFFDSTRAPNVLLSNEDGVAAGGPYSIGFRIACSDSSAAICASEVSSAFVKLAGTLSVKVTAGDVLSSPAYVSLPSGCKNPQLKTQSYADSIYCGTAAGVSLCRGAPHSNSRDLFVTETLVDANTISLRLGAGGDPMWVPSESTFKIGVELKCETP